MQLLARVLDGQFERKQSTVELRTELVSNRVQNPHEPEAHYAAKGQGQQKKEHLGYRVQVAETAQEQTLVPGQPTGQFITDLLTQPAEQSDEAGAEQVAEHQAQMAVLERPPIQYVDGAYVSAERLAQAHTEGWELIGPAQGPPNNNDGRFTAEAFHIQVEQRRAVCPAGKANTQCSRQEQRTPAFQARYQNRAGVEGTISELKRGHGLGQARYRGLEPVSLQNYLIGAACNVKRWINLVVWHLAHPAVSIPVAAPSG